MYQMNEKACSACHLIASGNVCPRCRTSTLSDDFSGLVIIFDPKGSAIAKVMKIQKKGRYALKVR
jgi:DNA-directed RNA polymerase subunit E"